jgi:hypothetical protein
MVRNISRKVKQTIGIEHARVVQYSVSISNKVIKRGLTVGVSSVWKPEGDGTSCSDIQRKNIPERRNSKHKA